MNEVQRDIIEAAEEGGWDLIRFDVGGTLVLREPCTDIELEVRGVLVSPAFVRSLPRARVVPLRRSEPRYERRVAAERAARR